MPIKSERLDGFSPEQSGIVRKVFSREDAVKFAQWTKDSSMGADMVESLNLFCQDREKGTPRLLVLVDACANFYYRQKFEMDETLTTKQRREFAGQVLHSLAEEKVGAAGGSVDNEEEVTEAMRQIFMEGFDDEGKLTSPGEVTTVLSGNIEELVKPWVEKDSPQAKVRTLAAQIQRIQTSAGESEDRADNLEERVNELGNLQELAEAQTTHIEDLQRRLNLVEAGGGGEDWGNVQQKAAQERYDNLDQQTEKAKVDALAAALLDFVPGEPLAKEVVSLLDNLFEFKLIDKVMGSTEWMKKSSLGGKDLSEETALVEAFQILLRMKELPDSKNKNKETELLANMAFYKGMGGVVRLRIEQIREERKSKAENERKIADLTVQAKALELGLGKFTDEDAEVITKIKQAADNLGSSLPDTTKKVNMAEELAVFFPQIKLKFKKGWKAVETEIGCTILSDLGSLAYFMDMRKLQEKKMFELRDNFMLGVVPGDVAKQRIGLYQENVLVAEIKAGKKPDSIVVSWQNNLDFGLGLQASRIVGQTLIDYVNKKGVIKNDFPEITLKKGTVTTEAVTELPVSGPVPEKTVEKPEEKAPEVEPAEPVETVTPASVAETAPEKSARKSRGTGNV